LGMVVVSKTLTGGRTVTENIDKRTPLNLAHVAGPCEKKMGIDLKPRAVKKGGKKRFPLVGERGGLTNEKLKRE